MLLQLPFCFPTFSTPGHIWTIFKTSDAELNAANINAVADEISSSMQQCNSHHYSLCLNQNHPKSHRLAFLRSHEERIAPPLTEVWFENSHFAKRCFDGLDRAYIGARYSRRYEITGEELEWLIQKIKTLQAAVQTICLKHLSRLEAPKTQKSWPIKTTVQIRSVG